MSNRYLEKIASLSKDEKNKLQRYGGIAGTVVGTNVALNQYHRGHLTGRETLYHGSSDKRIEQIKQEGLKPSKGQGVSKLVGDHLDNANEGLVFTTKSKGQAAMYSSQQNLIDSGKLKNPHDLIAHRMTPEFYKDMAHRVITGKGSAHINLPTWKKEFHGVANPEVKMMHDQIDKNIFMGKAQKDYAKAQVNAGLQDPVHVVKGKIGTEYIKGSHNYQKNSLKEVGEYIAHNKGRFAGGVGKAIGATALALGSAKMLKDSFSNKAK